MITEIQEGITRQLAQHYIKTGIQYGHQSKEWNPKMAPYFLYKKYGAHVFNVEKTFKFLRLAGNILEKNARKNRQILFVGTSKEASRAIALCAKEANIFYINYRWLGGMLTNWATLQKRIDALKQLELEYSLGNFKHLSKKNYSKKSKMLEKLQRFFEGIKNMKTLPNIVVFTSELKEKLAIQECQKLGISTISVVDSNCNPDLTPYPIPANDDSPGSLSLILQHLAHKIQEGKKKSSSQHVIAKKCSTFPRKLTLFKEKFLMVKK